MLEFSVLTSIMTVYGKVTMLKHDTILNNYLLENNISENYILFGICCIVTQRYNEKKHKYATLQAVPVCPIAISSSYLMPACFWEMP